MPYSAPTPRHPRTNEIRQSPTFVCPHCNTEQDRITEVGSERVYNVLDLADRYRGDSDHEAYDFDYYMCRECGEEIDFSSLPKHIQDIINSI